MPADIPTKRHALEVVARPPSRKEKRTTIDVPLHRLRKKSRPTTRVSNDESEAGGAPYHVSKGGPSFAQPTKCWLLAKAWRQRAFRVHDELGGNRYECIKIIGQGTYGVAYESIDKLSGDHVICKRSRDNAWDEFSVEVLALSQLDHANVINLLDVVVTPCLTLVLEYGGVSLHSLIRGQGMPSPRRTKLFDQLLSGVLYLHTRSVIHCDLKPSNIAIGTNDLLKVLDLGCCVFDAPGCRGRSDDATKGPSVAGIEYGTRWYRAPELLFGDGSFGDKVDEWSAGCILIEMAGGAPLFQCKTEAAMRDAILNLTGSPTDSALVYFAHLPLWSGKAARPYQDTRAVRFSGLLGAAEMELATRLLTLFPQERMSSAEALTRSGVCSRSVGSA